MAGNSNRNVYDFLISARDKFSGAFGKLKGAMAGAGSDARRLGKAWGDVEKSSRCVFRTISGLSKGIGLVFGASGGMVTMAKRMGSIAMEADNAASRAGGLIEAPKTNNWLSTGKVRKILDTTPVSI